MDGWLVHGVLQSNKYNEILSVQSMNGPMRSVDATSSRFGTELMPSLFLIFADCKGR